MNKLFSIMVALVVTMFSVSSFAWDPPASPAPASWISDTSGVLSPAAHQRLDAKLKVINQSSANEVAALIVPTLGGEDIADVTNATFKSWGVGKKDLDNGVLVVLAMKEHKMRIETGKGVEGDLPDLKTQDIQVNVMRPLMKSGNVEGALGNGFDAIASSIANHKTELAQRPTSTTPVATTSSNPTTTACAVGAVGAGGDDTGIVFLVLASLALVAVMIVLSNNRRKRIASEAEENRLALLESAKRRRFAEEARLAREREAAMVKSTPPVTVPTVPRGRPVAPPLPTMRDKPRAVAKIDHHALHAEATGHGAAAAVSGGGRATAVATSVAIAVAATELDERRRRQETQARLNREEEDRQRRTRERNEEDRKRRERDEEDERRRKRDEESRSSSSSSSSSYDGGSSWGGGSDSGGSGGFGGGDSGGGGSSSDW